MDEFVIFDATEDWMPTYKPFPGMPNFDPKNCDGSPVILDFEPVGSRVTCDPHPANTDEDWLILAESMRHLLPLLKNDFGFEQGGSELVDVENWKKEFGFQSLRLGSLNLIITESYEFFQRFSAASSVAKRLNLLRKADRIALFQAVLYGNSCDAGAPSPNPS